MKSRMTRFNFYLLVAALCVLGSSGAPPPAKEKKPKEKKVKDTVILAFHLEVNRDGSDKNGPVTINRSYPFVVNVAKDPFLHESHITQAAVVDDPLGGFALKVQFNHKGTWILEQYTTGNKGKRVAILCGFRKDNRWLAAPVLQKRIADGAFTFTPDASREEAEHIVRVLNQQGVQIQKDDR
jgi:preprotein translocase subunit SecD